MRAIFLPFAILCLQFGSCTSQKPPSPMPGAVFGSDADPVFFSLERTPCFGKCPAYTVMIRSDGSARYTGRSFAPREGEYSGQVDRTVMQALFDRASSIGFFDFQDKYDSHVTDIPSTIIRVNADGRDKKVLGRVQPPPAFKSFAAFADSLLLPVEWKKAASRE